MIWTGLTVLGEVLTSLTVMLFMIRHHVRLSLLPLLIPPPRPIRPRGLIMNIHPDPPEANLHG